MEFLGIVIVVRLICAGIAAAIASHKGRSVVGWFFGGLLIEIIAVIIVACLSNLKQEKAYKEQMESEQRRLREQLRQERIKTESFRRFSSDRLDAHDRILGVDTRSGAALPAGSAPAPLLPPGSGAGSAVPPPTPPQLGEVMQAAYGASPAAPDSAAPPSPQLGEVMQAAYGVSPAAGSMSPAPQEPIWYYECSGSPFGPVTEDEIRSLVRSGEIVAATLLWCEDLPGWTAARQVGQFRTEVFL